MGLEMGVMGLVAVPREQCFYQQGLWNWESDMVYSQRPAPSKVLLELQSLGIPKQGGSQNEPGLYNPDVKYWKKPSSLLDRWLLGRILMVLVVVVTDRGVFLFLAFSWILLSLQTPDDSFVVSSCGSGIDPGRLHVASAGKSTCKEYGNQKRCGSAALSQLWICCKDVLAQGKMWIKRGKLLWSGRNEGHNLKSLLKSSLVNILHHLGV